MPLNNKLNEPQQKAVYTLDGPVLIIAGAGSGKTRVITYRIANMLAKGIPQSSILALTFTNKAAREMESRVKELTGKKLQSLTVCTFHAFGVKILREEIEALGYRKNFSIYDETDRLEMIKESLIDCKIPYEGVDRYKLMLLFSNIKTGLSKWGIEDKSGNLADTAWRPVYEEYQQNLKIYNSLDFDDLLSLPIEIFNSFPEKLDKYRRRYRYIMVDEFQDTSSIQYKLMKMLATRNDGEKSNICVVGDDDQSIYSWRGASYQNLLSFEDDFPGTVEIKLEQNYRSSSTILDAANGVISNNTGRREKRLWSPAKGGKPVEVYFPENENEEAQFIAARIKELRYDDNLSYDNFGILIRTNSQIDCIEEALLGENIQCKISGGMSFFERKEIKDILSYLRVAANPDDDINLLRIINTPRRGIGKTTIKSLSDLAAKNRSSLWDSLIRFNKSREKAQENLFGEKSKTEKGELASFVSLIENLRENLLAKGELSKKVKSMTDNINYWGYLVTEHSKDEKKARWKYNNISYLIEMIENWETDPDNLDTSLYAYLNRISLLTRSENEDDSKGKVNLMTIHASKGLEFPVVFIAGAENGIIPHQRSIDESGDTTNSFEEERRLFYVAITRARDKLYITSCRKRKRLQSENEQAPSPFLNEIPAHLIEYHKDEPKDETKAAENFFAKMKERLGA